MNLNNQGLLYIVATPIGNLQDMSFRAIQILKSVDSILAEDTRHSLPLLQQFSITTPIYSLHEYNERERTENIINRLIDGKSIALISDAGTPLISDPGYFLVREARRHGIRVIPIPGACAAITALSVSGLPTDRFVFEGFLPTKSKARIDRLTELLNEPRTLIFYEAPHRIVDLLKDMQKVFGEGREVVLARELTKTFETILAGNLSKLLEVIETDLNQQRGEMVVMVEGIREPTSKVPAHDMLALLLEELPLKKAVEITAKLTGQRKNEIYDLALSIKKS